MSSHATTRPSAFDAFLSTTENKDRIYQTQINEMLQKAVPPLLIFMVDSAHRNNHI